jgi:hypothetical protein
MLVALEHFPIGLQAVLQLVQELRHHLMTDLVALLPELLSQVPHALTGPAQRRFGIAPGGRLDQSLQGVAQARVARGGRFSPPARSPHPTLRQRRRGLQLADALSDRPPRHAGRPGHRHPAAATVGHGFRRSHQPPHPLVQDRRQQLEPSLDRRCRLHDPRVYPPLRAPAISLPSQTPNRPPCSPTHLFPGSSLPRAASGGARAAARLPSVLVTRRRGADGRVLPGVLVRNEVTRSRRA